MGRDDSSSDATTIARPRLEADTVPRAGFVLEVESGPDQGKELEIRADDPQRRLLGKGPACDLSLTDPSVSRRHAALELAESKLRVRDLGSTNGTFVGELEVVEALLTGGELLRIGGTLLRVRAALVPIPPPSDAGAFGGVIGVSDAMRRLYPLCERLARADVPVVIEGETGTGKEQLAEALHAASGRAKRAFVVFDCTAVAPNLIESELFGHERGAFTGAARQHAGVFERAHGGTLLIDEIGDLPLPLQAKLLRAVERGEVTRVGGSQPLKVDVRVLAATRRDLDREVQLGRFRDDLFHRLAVARIELPPLRERHGDIPLLVQHFCLALGTPANAIPNELVRRWETQLFPGNVRELKNAVARRLALGDLADAEERPAPHALAHARVGRGDAISRVLSEGLPLAEARQRLVDEFDQRYVEHVLAEHEGNVTRAAAAAGVARRHLQRLKARFGGGEEPEE
ncbi:MAG: sigma 54-interacting transcriptional regulator [Polyangiaceae bacterium]